MSNSKLPNLQANTAVAHETSAWLSGWGFGLASELLFHYLYGKGSPMELNYEELLSHPIVQLSHYLLQRRIKKAVELKATGMRNDTVLSVEAADISPPHKEGNGLPYSFVESYYLGWVPFTRAMDLAGAVGTANISADPQIIITKHRGHIKLSGTVNYEFHDYYDFDLLKPEINADMWSKIRIGGENAARQAFGFIASGWATFNPIDLTSGNMMDFSELDDLQKYGMAANFEITSNIHTELAEDYF